MADAGLFIGWGEVVRGRETEAVEHFDATIEYFTGLQADGAIESFEPVSWSRTAAISADSSSSAATPRSSRHSASTRSSGRTSRRRP